MSLGRIISSGLTWPLMKSVIGVSTNAGASATLLTPSPPSSLFIDSVQPITAALVAAYTDSQAAPPLAEIEERFTTSALRCSAPAARSRSAHSR
jgi:hypothetical protein